MKVDAVKLNNEYTEPMMITWDTGKKCNYDCTYCEASRHDNYSKFHSLDEYLETFNFIKQYVEIYESHKQNKANEVNINFTGGEPTLNPNFWHLASKIKQDDAKFRLSLTTNGAWSKKYTSKIQKHFSGVTVSYHAESNESLKKLVIDNILSINQTDLWLQVNVMLHADYFDECVEVYEHLKQNGVKVNPRPIGDGNVSRKGWFVDDDGVLGKQLTNTPKNKLIGFFEKQD